MFQKSFGVELFKGNSLNAIHKNGIELKFYRFLNGSVSEIETESTPFLDDKVKTVGNAMSDGYYMILSEKEEMFFAKGNLDRVAFIRYNMEDQLSEIDVTRIDVDGNDIAQTVATLLIGSIYVMNIPSSLPEILNIGDDYIACEPLVVFSETNVYYSNNKMRVTANPIKTDIISNELLTRVRNNRLSASIRHTRFMSS